MEPFHAKSVHTTSFRRSLKYFGSSQVLKLDMENNAWQITLCLYLFKGDVSVFHKMTPLLQVSVKSVIVFCKNKSGLRYQKYLHRRFQEAHWNTFLIFWLLFGINNLYFVDCAWMCWITSILTADCKPQLLAFFFLPLSRFLMVWHKKSNIYLF